jgi:putative Mg2+ transporter-C (MgtC) family protein
MTETNLYLQLTLTLHLSLATLLSAVIGLNREHHHKSAGLRTHMLTGFGACLFTLISVHGFSAGDPTRVASNVVTGIGFLSGGIIVQRKNETYDLTTAAGVWATAAIGMAVGVGFWFIAIFATLMLWLTLAILQRLKPIMLNEDVVEKQNGNKQNDDNKNSNKKDSKEKTS